MNHCYQERNVNHVNDVNNGRGTITIKYRRPIQFTTLLGGRSVGIFPSWYTKTVKLKLHLGRNEAFTFDVVS